ncbi:DNA-binding SARP family transcriptional activator [Kribbella sp. VKM Ac-2527]|uniref:DNA-binding SARP family transcriptional activator n=1 Tax=Kribbella caucasensis TaxID=2512215 RepID=A0A4R6KTV5_9ACTN|nr:BTAD domain-containing putative transcriptional regulator [Kribbella sp. VKM Ac-2527]TDO54487.1 DNA-binding SARP family transcriptional activator [Kribbella sp. VKM Ac-2527]
MDSLRYEILGPLRLGHVQGQPLKASKPRQLLATLLLHPNRFVSTDLIADALWEGNPPRSATANIRTYVRALRGVLQEAGLPTPIDTSAAGYSIEVGVDELDSSMFESLLAEGGHLRDADEGRQAMQVLSRAYSLWRGHPLEDLGGSAAWEGSIARLEAQYRSLVDTLLDLRLEYADHAGAAVLLSGRLTEDPYDEQLWRRLVDTLLAAGRTSEARAAYTKAVRTLADELGVEPGPDLAAAGARAQNGRSANWPDPGVPRVSTTEPSTLPATEGPMAAPELVEPHRPPSQLPLDLADFSGREQHLEQLRDLVCGRDPVRPPIAVVSGAPGTGKTSLAIRLGHLVRESFPDGQIYLDMRGATEPRDSGGALTDLLLSLNVPDFAVPPDPERRSAMLRSELASRRVLIILDDAAAASQIAPLMPGTGASAVVVTSRNRLMDLAGADSMPLDTFEDSEAAELLQRVAGTGRVDSRSAAVEEILSACGNLPLAIRIVASRLAQRPDLSPAELARRLRDETHRLDELSIGELAVRTSADLSYDSLSPAEARLYRLIGRFAVGVFSARVLEPVASPASVRRSLDRLIEVNLVQISSVDATGKARYRVHDLLRLHAIGVGEEAEKAQALKDLATLLDALLDKVRRAAAALPFVYFGNPDYEGPLRSPDPAPFTDADAIAWFDSERSTFVPAIRAAAQNGLHEYAWRLAAAWGPYLDMRAGFDDWNESHQPGLISAIACGDRRGEAILHRNLGQLALYRDDWEPAWEHFTQAAAIFAEVGDRLGDGVAAVGLGTWLRERGRLDEALAQYEKAVEAFVEVGDKNGEASARSAVASIWLARNDTVTAGRYMAEAFLIGVRLGDKHREAKIRRRIAALRTQQGRHDQAVRQLQASLAIFNGIGDDHCAAYARAELGAVLMALGQDAAARKMLLDAIEIGHRLGDRSVEGAAAHSLGRLHATTGNADFARRYLNRAVRSWQQIGNDAKVADARAVLTDLGTDLAAG